MYSCKMLCLVASSVHNSLHSFVIYDGNAWFSDLLMALQVC